MSTVTPNLGLFKYDTTNVTDLASAFNIKTALNNNWDIIDNAISNTSGARNVGEIVASTLPLEDAGLHLLDGALIDGSGIYSEFVQYIANLYTNNSTANYFTDETTWQDTVTNYGVCGKFVYDSVNNTVRLPNITGDISQLGHFNTYGGTGVFKNSNWRIQEWHWAGTNAFPATNINFNAANSNSIYGNSNTVQPQTIRVLYYIVIATSSKTDIQVDIDEIATDLNGKADTDLTNVPASKAILQESYVNGTSWYRIYSDGWCEQGGRAALNETSTTTVMLLKAYADMNYSVSAVSITASTANDTEAGLQCTPVSATQITLTAHYINPNSQIACWQACGYIN